jgi:glucose/mannose transport system substrate-binding protein
VTVVHWWTSPSESAALGALIKEFNERYPGLTVVPSVAASGGNLRILFPMVEKLDSEQPAAFQMFAGYAAQVFFDAGLLSPIDELWANGQLEDVIPPVIRDLNKFNGHYYSVPVNVHRTNVVWYNKALLDRYAINPGSLTTWDAFFAATEKLKAKGVANPIALGVDWTHASVFEGIMASQGIGTYQDWINGKITNPNDVRLVSAFQTYGQYLAYSNADFLKVGWNTAVARVMKGESAFCLMGDWADGEFRAADMKYGKDYGALLVPGTQTMFGLGVDTFQHPKASAGLESSSLWLSFAASRAGQDAFNPLKGSIPARTDPDLTRYDPYQRLAIADLKASRWLYPTIASAVPEVFRSSIFRTLMIFARDHDAQKAATAMADATSSHVNKFTRTWSLK